jgi:WD40 repeat protein
VKWSPDGSNLAVLAGQVGSWAVQVLKIDMKTRCLPLKDLLGVHGTEATYCPALSWHKSGQQLLTSAGDLIDVPTGAEGELCLAPVSPILNGTHSPVTCAQFSPDGSFIAAGCACHRAYASI